MTTDDEFFSPASAVARLDAADRAQITAKAVEWVQAKLEKEQTDLSKMPLDAFVAGAAWSMQFRWE